MSPVLIRQGLVPKWGGSAAGCPGLRRHWTPNCFRHDRRSCQFWPGKKTMGQQRKEKTRKNDHQRPQKYDGRNGVPVGGVCGEKGLADLGGPHLGAAHPLGRAAGGPPDLAALQSMAGMVSTPAFLCLPTGPGLGQPPSVISLAGVNQQTGRSSRQRFDTATTAPCCLARSCRVFDDSP